MKKQEQPAQTEPAPLTKNLKNFSALSLDGEKVIVDDLHKLVGNALYFTARDISVLDAAKAIYKEEDFEVSDMLVEAVRATDKTIALWLISQIVEFLQTP